MRNASNTKKPFPILVFIWHTLRYLRWKRASIETTKHVDSLADDISVIRHFHLWRSSILEAC